MRLLITAGPTREPIDAVRYISNRSSGLMGLALTQAAVDLGHDVTLLLGPGPGDDAAAAGCTLYRFNTAADLDDLLKSYWPKHDLLVMAAAVADYRPKAVHRGKLRQNINSEMNLELEPIDDLVAAAAATKRPDQRVIAFALEPAESLVAGAQDKLTKKGVDAIVANPLSAMDAHSIDAYWLAADGDRQHPGIMTKSQFSHWLVNKITCDLGL
jgi:phosphopantothenoylcysteine decarboxylase/phosphopantothenate--cysteine ligase